MTIKFSKPNIKKRFEHCSKSLKKRWLTHGKYTSLFEKNSQSLLNLDIALLFQAVLRTFNLFSSGFKKVTKLLYLQ